MTPRPLLAATVALLTLLGAACGSDDEGSDDGTSTGNEDELGIEEDEPSEDEQAATPEECVDELFAILEDADFSDTDAVTEDVNEQLGVKCSSVDRTALGEVLREREDELSDEAFAFLNGATREELADADAAGKPCVPLADPLPEGSPAVEVPVGPPPTELVITDIAEGDGAEVTETSTVTVDYIGVACSTGKIFDASYERGEPVEFPLDGVIEGWSTGLVGMKVGGTRQLVIPPEQGYGEAGAGADIGPNETLVFVVELRSVA